MFSSIFEFSLPDFYFKLLGICYKDKGSIRKMLLFELMYRLSPHSIYDLEIYCDWEIFILEIKLALSMQLFLKFMVRRPPYYYVFSYLLFRINKSNLFCYFKHLKMFRNLSFKNLFCSKIHKPGNQLITERIYRISRQSLTVIYLRV